jgi:hypothetical protein
MEDIIKAASSINNFLDTINNWLIPIVTIIIFFSKEKIKHFFNRDIISLKEGYKIDFERRKEELNRHTELLKLDIDIKRNISSNILDKKLVVYQGTLTILSRFIRIMIQINQGIKLENQNVSSKNVNTMVSKQIEYIEDNYLFYSNEVSKTLNKIGKYMNDILSVYNTTGKVEEQSIAEYNSLLKQLRNILMEEIINQMPSSNMPINYP